MRFEKRTPELRLRLEGWRSRLVLGVLGFAFALLAGRAFYLQAMNHDFLQQKGEARYGRVVEMPASRGPVKDRQGQPLAVSTPVESIWASPEDFEGGEARIRALARALALDPAELRQKVANKDRQFVWLKRQISPEQALKVMALNIPGVFQQREFRRFYPAGEVMAHVVGFTGIDDSGQEGIELAQQPLLAGVPGSRKVIKDRKGRIVEDVSSLKVPRDGRELTLSIDQRLQFLAHRELKAAVEANKAKAGSLVMLDAKTGEVLALREPARLQPEQPRLRLTGRQDAQPLGHRPLRAGIDVMKLFMAAAFEAGVVRPDTPIQTAPGTPTIGRWTISDSHPSGLLTVAQVIQKSSNVGSAKIMLAMPQRMGSFFHELGFGSAPETASRRGEGDAAALGAMAADRAGDDVLRARPAGVAAGCSSRARLHDLPQRGAVAARAAQARGRAHRQARRFARDRPRGDPDASRWRCSPGARGAARGGARLPRGRQDRHRAQGRGRGYAEHKYVSSFVGFGPVSAPRFIVAVMLDEPAGAKYYGGDVSAPVFSSVMGAALRMMSVPPDAPQTLNARAPALPAATQARAAPAGREG